MTTSLKDLEKIVNSGLSTAIKKSEIKFNQLFIYIFGKVISIFAPLSLLFDA